MSVCTHCGGRLLSREERTRAICSTCVVASWSDEKREVMRKLVRAAFVPTSEEEKGRLVDEAFKQL